MTGLIGSVEAFRRLRQAADDPLNYVGRWKAEHRQPVVGIFPMNFPVEIVHAAGALPVIIQEDAEPITAGNNLLSEFNCGYTRNIADQAAMARLGSYDAFVLADHCIQIFGAADVVREYYPDTPLIFSQLISAMGDRWTTGEVMKSTRSFVSDLEGLFGKFITSKDLQRSIVLFNENRRLQRWLFDARRDGRLTIPAAAMQVIVKSSMVMDIEEHSGLLREIKSASERNSADPDLIRLHLSGHFCHAPKPNLLDLIESAGAIVVDDDLYHGARYISTDTPENVPPLEGLAAWYLNRNVAIPCPTRVQNDVDWDAYLLQAIEKSGAEAIVVLMAKFCEPHMLYYPELKRALEERGVPHVLIETEHEGLAAETVRTRIEAMLERIRRARRAAAPHAAALSACS
ncbi:2-hydroxyacyl-CoA dehydratase subunit D [Sphingomonas sp. ID0503]|uniref:2-hydroxyacyl-CoA dehydratase subunit D n=1 Tax=Sphingomonas sp. ID0503 TaxID=3399691 RepID=UPI003AFB1DB4